MNNKLKAIILVAGLAFASNPHLMAEDFEPLTAGIIIGSACVAGTLIGTAGIESYNLLTTPTNSMDLTTTNTMDLTTTNSGNNNEN